MWDRVKKFYFEFPSIGLAVDLSRMNFKEDYLGSMEPKMRKAFEMMSALEHGAIANPDEKRMVGHYWLRNPSMAPTPEIRQEIETTFKAIQKFSGDVHDGVVLGNGGKFKNLLIIGIGGSALGPQFVANALGHPSRDKLNAYFFDNTDPDGIESVLSTIGGDLGRTLCVVISKSGGTKETRNGMLEAKASYSKAGLNFATHAVAVTGAGSQLDNVAEKEKWLCRFPMWDWVGGRTSETSAVGLLPAALQGFDVQSICSGAQSCDEVTRNQNIIENPSALLALMWYHAGNGRGGKDMVILPYKDRLELFSRYLQQLIMESLGKETDLDGKVVHQGIAVYGNKGSTDQHAYVQQLIDGVNNFFATFIEVLRDQEGEPLMVEPGVTSGDYLSGFLLGTRQALYDKGRDSVTLTIRDVSPFSVGVLIALYERAVGLYGSLININAYHQPGVESGKKAASKVILIQLKVQEFLVNKKGTNYTCEALAEKIGETEHVETIFKVCEHLSSNPSRGIRKTSGKSSFTASYEAI